MTVASSQRWRSSSSLETVEDGVGPIFNAESCGSCHLTPIIGGSSQITEKRVGFYDGFQFLEPPGGSLIQDRATDVSLQEYAAPYANVATMRASLSVLGDGFVEAVDPATFRALADVQPSFMRGQLLSVPVNELLGATGTGRFGWKDQHASLTSFAADAYKNEMGITSPLDPDEPTANGTSVAAYDMVPEGNPSAPDDDGVDVALFALFMRSTLAPPRDEIRAASQAAQIGEKLFRQLGCAVCHRPALVTAPLARSSTMGP
ncbi:MAG: di-heme oxidoredictase family protein [Tepidisphaeraceae bacterium]